jgi:hypothetical protein
LGPGDLSDNVGAIDYNIIEVVKMTEEQKQLSLEIDDATSKGSYSNFALIMHNQNEFMIDFAFLHPQKAKVVSRIITNPSHAKRLLAALAENVKQYEKKFGEIKETQAADKSLNVKLSNN